MSIIERMKWWFAGREMAELHRWRTRWQVYRQWMAMFPEVAISLDAMKEDVDQGKIEFIHVVRDRVIAARKKAHGELPGRSEDMYWRQKAEDDNQ